MAEERLLTVQEVASRLGANVETVRRWLRSGQLPGIMPGGNKLGYRIAESELERFLEGKRKAA